MNSLCANALLKGFNPSFLTLSLGKYLGRLSFFNFCSENFELKPLDSA